MELYIHTHIYIHYLFTEHDDSCKKNSRRISVFCNNKDSTDFSKITSRFLYRTLSS